MIELHAKTLDVSLNLDETLNVTIRNVPKCHINELRAIKDKELSIYIKNYKNRRSTSQNAYLWALLDEIAKVLKSSKEEVYKEFVKDYGVFEIIPIKNEAVDSFKKRWEKNGLGWFTQSLGKSKIDGYEKLIVYYGSSTYDSKEMTRLLEQVINQCNELGIATLTCDEVLKLKNENDD